MPPSRALWVPPDMEHAVTMVGDADLRTLYFYQPHGRCGPGVEPQVRKLTVFFNGDSFARAEGDEMPSESEFVASLKGMKGTPKVPQLEASEAQLAKYPARNNAEAEQAAANLPPAAASYPSLESR